MTAQEVAPDPAREAAHEEAREAAQQGPERTCLVTGATGALGRATAHRLAERGHRVVLLSRDAARGEAARQEIAARTGKPNVELLVGDLASLESVRQAAARFRDLHGRLDVLIHTAAIYTAQRTLTVDSLEAMFATNHLGPFLLTYLLQDALAAQGAAHPSRVIVVSAPTSTPLDFDDLQGERSFSALRAFGASKMANLLFTYELARRWDGRGITANALHPGLIRSDLMRDLPAPMRWLGKLVSAPPERAAAAPVYLAEAPELEGVTGRFFKGRTQSESHAYSRDPEAQRRLWDVSLALAGL